LCRRRTSLSRSSTRAYGHSPPLAR
jgi:hypothetical protein